MKVLFCTYDAPHFFGPNVWLQRLVPQLIQKGVELEVLFFVQGDLRECRTIALFRELGIKCHLLGFFETGEKKVPEIVRIAKESRCDVFVPNMLVQALYAARWIKAFGVPTIGLLHSDDRFYHSIVTQFVAGTEEWALSSIVTGSRYLKDLVLANPKRRAEVHCIPYGVPTHNYGVDFDRPVLRLIYAGRFSQEQKRIQETAEAICRMVSKKQDLEAVFYGEGDETAVKQAIEKFSVADRVHLEGTVPSELLSEAYRRAHIFVLLSDYEGLPQALLEAMACGLVCVCTAVSSGISELIKHQKTGLIVTDRNDSFDNAIESILRDRENAKRLSSAARQSILKDYTTEANAAKWYDLLTTTHDRYSNKSFDIAVRSRYPLPKPRQEFLYEDYREVPLWIRSLQFLSRKLKAARERARRLRPRRLLTMMIVAQFK